MALGSPVSGVSGAARIQRLSGVALAAAEAHGKRLDHNGRARSISGDGRRITSTGLDLRDLYDKHAEGAARSKSSTLALHLILQFPKDLIPEADSERMLRAARQFAKKTFGSDACFADRMDLDEKGKHAVDLFLAPKYTKRTKHTEKVAISTTRHLKALAKKHGKAPTLRGQGQALQSEWFEFLRDEMGLEAVQRGVAKDLLAPDWVSPEELAAEARVRQLEQQVSRLEAESLRLTRALRAAEGLWEVVRGVALEKLPVALSGPFLGLLSDAWAHDARNPDAKPRDPDSAEPDLEHDESAARPGPSGPSI